MAWWHSRVPGQDQWLPEDVVGADEWGAGWATAASTGAVASWSLVLRWAVWFLLVADLLLGALALVAPSSAAAPPVRVVQRGSDGAESAGPAGFAQLFVAAYVSAGEGSQSALDAFYPGADGVDLTGKPGTWHAEQLATVRMSTVAPGYWSVVVAARVTGPGPSASPTDSSSTTDSSGSDGAAQGSAALRYFQVAVRSSDPAGHGGLVAVALPSEVSAPGRAQPPSLNYGPSHPAQSSDPAVQTLQGFLAAYLTGSEGLDRYLSPGTTLSPVTPAPYTAVQISQISQIAGPDGSDADQSQTVPRDGTRRHLLVDIAATAPGGVTRPLTYAVELAARAGRWEVASLEAAPQLATTSSGAQAPSAVPAPAVSPSTTPSAPAATATSPSTEGNQ
ncbi:conjugal transfer protein [Streptomyces sp. NPDC054933]